jgi:sugar-phosphatase
MLRATIFDMDGLLLDSEKLWHEAEVEILGELGVPINRDGTRLTKGMFVAEVVSFWYQRHPWSGPTELDVVDRVLARVGELVENGGELMPGAVRALELAGERGPVVVGSSTPLPLIERCLRHFDLLSHFQSLHSADREPFGKPHPGVFLSAAKALDVPPSACLVFEDSAAGVLAAKAARMTCVAVPTPDERSLPAFGIADLVLASLDDLSRDWLDERFES